MSDRWPRRTTTLLLAAASLICAAPALAEPTASLHGVLTDNAVVKRSIAGPTVTIGAVAAAIDGQSYSAQGLSLGVQALVVRAPGHITSTQMVTLLPGDKTVDVALELTAKETYRRYYAAYNGRRFSTAWKMVHPDVRDTMLQWGKPLTYGRYVWYMKTWNLPFVSMRIKSISNVASWKPARRAGLPHARYSHLKRIARVIRYRFNGGVVDEPCYIQWQQISGRWYAIFDAAFYAR